MKNLNQHVNIGDMLRVQFWDHALGGPLIKPFLCTVTGTVDYIDEHFVRLEAWTVQEEADVDSSNNEAYAILLSTIETCELATELCLLTTDDGATVRIPDYD